MILGAIVLGLCQQKTREEPRHLLMPIHCVCRVVDVEHNACGRVQVALTPKNPPCHPISVSIAQPGGIFQA